MLHDASLTTLLLTLDNIQKARCCTYDKKSVIHCLLRDNTIQRIMLLNSTTLSHLTAYFNLNCKRCESKHNCGPFQEARCMSHVTTSQERHLKILIQLFNYKSSWFDHGKSKEPSRHDWLR